MTASIHSTLFKPTVYMNRLTSFFPGLGQPCTYSSTFYALPGHHPLPPGLATFLSDSHPGITLSPRLCCFPCGSHQPWTQCSSLPRPQSLIKDYRIHFEERSNSSWHLCTRFCKFYSVASSFNCWWISSQTRNTSLKGYSDIQIRGSIGSSFTSLDNLGILH